MKNKDFVENLRQLAKKINLKKTLTAKGIKQILEEQYIERAKKARIIIKDQKQ